MDLRKIVLDRVNLIHLAQETVVVGSCEHDSELLYSIKGVEFLV